MTAISLTRATKSELALPPEPVSQTCVLDWVRRIGGGSEHWPAYPEIAFAIAQAATNDPLFEGADGSLQTAALLTALAATQSGFHPTLVGREGRAFGLYQIEVPAPDISADVFLLPSTASYAAIEIMRQKLAAPGDDSLEERLRWYGEAGHRPRARLHLTRMLLAA